MELLTEFRRSVLKLLDEGKFMELKQLLYEKQTSEYSNNIGEYLDLAISLIDLGDESLDSVPIHHGLKLLQLKETEIKKYASADSINYCLANAHAALYRITREETPNEIPTLDEVTQYLSEAKNYYWKSLKKLGQKNKFFDQKVYVNLGNCLHQSGRIVEAITWHEYALRIDNKLPQAVAGKLDGVLSAYRNGKIQPTPFLFFSLIQGYKRILSNDAYPQFVKRAIKKNQDWCIEHCNELGLNQEFNDFLDNHQTAVEFERMIPEKKFILLNHLSLNEHSLYCNCNGTLYDDLWIIHQNLPLEKSNDTLDVYFKRISEEYLFARRLYFTAVSGGDFSEESLRVSFRLCFGVFDKIAQGICQLYSLEKSKNESIYFTNFWRSNSNRHKQLNAIKNIHLIGLYSIAADLNKIDGEFGYYKEYRNKLEHDILLLSDSNDDIPMERFKVNTLHVLQLCRAAIFGFVFCAREGLIQKSKMGQLHQD